MNEAIEQRTVDTNIAKIIYVLYLLGLVSGITAVIGVIMAYVYRDDAPDWLKTHYELQIRSFWMVLLYGLIAGLLCLILIGFLLLFLVAVWWVVRCVKGLKYVSENAPYPNPRSWLF
jgi:uncharacterized membrane protein